MELTHCPTLGGAIGACCIGTLWDLGRSSRVFFSVPRLTSIVLCFFAFIHVVWKRWSSTCCIPEICQNQLQSVLTSLISSMGWYGLHFDTKLPGLLQNPRRCCRPLAGPGDGLTVTSWIWKMDDLDDFIWRQGKIVTPKKHWRMKETRNYP